VRAVRRDRGRGGADCLPHVEPVRCGLEQRGQEGLARPPLLRAQSTVARRPRAPDVGMRGRRKIEWRLCLILAIRKRRICVISDGDMSAKEGRTYHEQVKKKTDVQE
jgi:hypothetical protein